MTLNLILMKRKAAFRAGITPALGAELLTDGGMENWNSATDLTSWTEGIAGTSSVNREGTVKVTGNYAARLDVDGSSSIAKIEQAIVNSAGDFIRIECDTRANAAGKEALIRVGNTYDAPIIVETTSFAHKTYVIWTLNANSVVGFRRGAVAANSNFYIDNLSAKKNTLTSCFGSKWFTSLNGNVIVRAKLKVAAGTQAGCWICVDNPASPTNGIGCYVDGVNAWIIKVVAGTYSLVYSTASAWSDWDELKVIKNGATVQLFKNDVQIGTNQTVSDVSVKDLTTHVQFSTYEENRFRSFSVA